MRSRQDGKQVLARSISIICGDRPRQSHQEVVGPRARILNDSTHKASDWEESRPFHSLGERPGVGKVPTPVLTGKDWRRQPTLTSDAPLRGERTASAEQKVSTPSPDDTGRGWPVCRGSRSRWRAGGRHRLRPARQTCPVVYAGWLVWATSLPCGCPNPVHVTRQC
jgi:hypothetical protein